MKPLKSLLSEAYSNYIMFSEGGAAGHMAHVWELDDVTFGEIKDIFEQLFSGELEVSEKTDGQNLTVTFKDGEIKAARNKATLKEPMSIEQVADKYSGEDRATIKKAFVETMEDVESAVKSMSDKEIKQIFNDGQNFISLEVIFPPTKNVVDYGGRCLVQFHGLAKYDDNFNKIGEDKELAKKLYNILKSHDALNQKTFEIAGPAVLKIKNAKSAEKAKKEILSDIDKLMDTAGANDNTTVEQFVAKYYGEKIKEAAENHSIELDSEALAAVVDRMNPFNSKPKLKKQELNKLLASKNADLNSQQTKSFFSDVEAALDDDVTSILLPLEAIIVKGGTMLIENLSGFVSADKSASAKKLADELDAALDELNKKSSNGEIADGKLHTMLKNLKKLDIFGKTPTGIEGIVFTWKGRLAKLTANFGAINQLLGLFKYDR